MTRPGHFWEPVIPQTRRKPGGNPASTRNAAGPRSSSFNPKSLGGSLLPLWRPDVPASTVSLLTRGNPSCANATPRSLTGSADGPTSSPHSKWAEVVDVAGEAAERAKVASAATATLLTIDTNCPPMVATADVNSLMSLVPDQLLPVRRPASHKGMKNYISRVVVPTEAHECRAVWCESFNELTHLRDLLITRQPTQVATQPFRLEWIMSTGVRGHVPDFLFRDADGRPLLVDVTTRTKLDDPRLQAVLQLTATTAEALGWEYQVRTELPAQRVRNINFLHTGRNDTDQDRVGASRVLRQTPGSIDVQRASDLLGGGPQGFVRLWDLIAHGHVHVNLDSVMELDSTVAFQATGGGAPWLHTM